MKSLKELPKGKSKEERATTTAKDAVMLVPVGVARPPPQGREKGAVTTITTSSRISKRKSLRKILKGNSERKSLSLREIPKGTH